MFVACLFYFAQNKQKVKTIGSSVCSIQLRLQKFEVVSLIFVSLEITQKLHGNVTGLRPHTLLRCGRRWNG